MSLCNAYNRFVWLKVLTKKALAQQARSAYLQYSIFGLEWSIETHENNYVHQTSETS
jgi:hypothetical protein